MQKYRDNLTAEELASLTAELDALDAAYADAYDAEPCVPCDEEWEDYDPVKMGWVDRNGRP